MRISYKFLLLTFLLNVFCINAQNVYTLQSTKEPTQIGSQFLYYFDETHKLTLSEVEKRTDFIATTFKVPNYNVISSAAWGKIKFTCTEDADWYLNLEPPTYTEIILYQKINNGGWKESKCGNAVPIEQRAMPVNHILFKLNLHKGDTITAFFRLYDYYPVHFNFRAGTLQSFTVDFHNEDFFNCICYGIMLMMMLYNLYLFIIQREKIYLFYVLYVLFNLMFSTITGGYVFHYPVFIQQFILQAPAAQAGLFGCFLLFFTLELFKGLIPSGIKKVIYVFCSLMILNSILSAIPDYRRTSYIVIQAVALVLGIISIVCGVIALQKGDKSAKYYLMGFGAYLSSLFYLIIAGSGIFSMDTIVFRVMLGGSAFEAIMLSFALGDKFKYFQEEALAHAMENERLVKEQNIFLEQKVKERTAEVVAQKELIEEKQKEILDSIRYAKRIQQAQLPNESYIDRILNKFKK